MSSSIRNTSVMNPSHDRAAGQPDAPRRGATVRSPFGVVGSLGVVAMLAVAATGCKELTIGALPAGEAQPAASELSARPAGAIATVQARRLGGSTKSNGAKPLAPPIVDPTGRPFSPSSPFNTPTAPGTQWFDTPRLHALPSPINGDTFQHWFVLRPFGVYHSLPTDPMWTFDMPDYIAADWHRNRPAQSFQVRAPADLAHGTDTDKVTVVVDGANYYEVWNTRIDSTNRIVTNDGTPGWATGDFVNGPGAGALANNDGVRAANFSWAAGLITGRDIANGSIDHALAIALTRNMLDDSYASYVAPATAWDNASGSTGPIKMGTKLGIPAGTPKPLGLSPIGSMVFDALQRYGAYVGDFVGGDWPAFYADKLTVTDAQIQPLYAWWDQGGRSDLDKMAPLLRVADYQP